MALGPTRGREPLPFLVAEQLAAMRDQAQALRGLRVLHLSASPLLSAVADTLRALVPLQRDLGIAADWWLIGDLPDQSARVYAGLRGDPLRWSAADSAAWHATGGLSATALPPGYDLIVVHDPQLLPLQTALPRARARSRQPQWVWHCHLDPTAASPDLWADVQATLAGYAAALFPAAAMIPAGLPVPQVRVAPPVLDPSAPRNRPLADDVIHARLQHYGIDPARPVLGQFAPIDDRFGPLMALAVYTAVAQHAPGVQLLLAETGGVPHQRDATSVDHLRHMAAVDPDVHLVLAEMEPSALDLNALQSGCAVALQLAVPRGFGWGLAECQWKGKPAIVGRTGELPSQVASGGGYVVDDVAAASTHVGELLGDPALATELGSRGHQFIAQQHLSSRLAHDYLGVFDAIVATAASAPPSWEPGPTWPEPIRLR
jgi:trehalose synthase